LVAASSPGPQQADALLRLVAVAITRTASRRRFPCWAKASGLRSLPFWGFAANDVWLTLVCVAQTVVCWAQALLLSGGCKLAEPKTLRYRLWHVAGRIVRHARRLIVRLDRAWSWATDLVTAFAGLGALPALP
jgi:hypothetical protein